MLKVTNKIGDNGDVQTMDESDVMFSIKNTEAGRLTVIIVRAK